MNDARIESTIDKMTLALVIPCKNEHRRLDVSAFLDAIRVFPWLTFLFVDD